MKLKALSEAACRDAVVSPDELDGLNFGDFHTLWGVGGRLGRIFYLVTFDEPHIQVPPGWYPHEVFEATEINTPPFWTFRASPVFISDFDTDNWDWIIADRYFLETAERLLRLADLEPEEFESFRIHASRIYQLERKWEARARIDAIAPLLTPNQSVEALALVEAGEFELLEQIIESCLRRPGPLLD